MTTERLLRAAALLIAAMAFVDPSLTRAAIDRPTVVVLNASPADRSLSAQIAAALATRFDVSRVDRPGAAAYVLAGADLPESFRPPAEQPVFAVVRGTAGPTVEILQLTAPAEVSLDSFARVLVDLQLAGTGDRDVTVTLIADGVRLRQVTERVTGTNPRVQIPLTFVPTSVGVARLRVEASVAGSELAVADKTLRVNTRVWRVLAFDGRPSYPGTFVRRALEADPRFSVTTRVVTSRGSTLQTQSGPASLGDWQSLSAFDLIVVGAPDVFGGVEARALERYLRERHGAVVLLPEAAGGTILQQLTGQAGWVDDRRVEPVPVSATGNDAWTASEFLWPARWPPLSAPLATVAAEAESRAAVWQIPIGGGRVVVSSAVDGWRSRAGVASGYSAFWRATAAAAAQATPPDVDVSLRDQLLTPGQWSDVTVGLFGPGNPTARVRDVQSVEQPVRLWPAQPAPSGTRREWVGSFRAPSEPGRYRLEVTSSATQPGVADFIVVAPDGVDEPVRPALEGNGLSSLAASAHRGRVVPADQLSLLPAQISEVVASNSAREPWHPMRSTWWLVPFTLCAAGEWWLRRHRGER